MSEVPEDMGNPQQEEGGSWECQPAKCTKTIEDMWLLRGLKSNIFSQGWNFWLHACPKQVPGIFDHLKVDTVFWIENRCQRGSRWSRQATIASCGPCKRTTRL